METTPAFNKRNTMKKGTQEPCATNLSPPLATVAHHHTTPPPPASPVPAPSPSLHPSPPLAPCLIYASATMPACAHCLKTNKARRTILPSCPAFPHTPFRSCDNATTWVRVLYLFSACARGPLLLRVTGEGGVEGCVWERVFRGELKRAWCSLFYDSSSSYNYNGRLLPSLVFGQTHTHTHNTRISPSTISLKAFSSLVRSPCIAGAVCCCEAQQTECTPPPLPPPTTQTHTLHVNHIEAVKNKQKNSIRVTTRMTIPIACFAAFSLSPSRSLRNAIVFPPFTLTPQCTKENTPKRQKPQTPQAVGRGSTAQKGLNTPPSLTSPPLHLTHTPAVTDARQHRRPGGHAPCPVGP